MTQSSVTKSPAPRTRISRWVIAIRLWTCRLPERLDPFSRWFWDSEWWAGLITSITEIDGALTLISTAPHIVLAVVPLLVWYWRRAG